MKRTRLEEEVYLRKMEKRHQKHPDLYECAGCYSREYDEASRAWPKPIDYIPWDEKTGKSLPKEVLDNLMMNDPYYVASFLFNYQMPRTPWPCPKLVAARRSVSEETRVTMILGN